MDKVHNNIWISNKASVHEESLSDYGINYVITVCQDSTEDNVGCGYKQYNMSDGPNNKYGGKHDYETFRKAADKLYDKVSSNNTVLIHCHRGQSRSVSVAVAVVGVIEDLTTDNSLQYIKNSREQADPDELLLNHAEKYINNN